MFRATTDRLHSFAALPVLLLLAARPAAYASDLGPPVGNDGASSASIPSQSDTVPPAPEISAPAHGSGVWQPLSGRERWRLYLKETFASPWIVPRAGFPALVRHLDHDPEQWGQGRGAYATRFADRYGRFFVRQGVESTGAAALRHEVRYLPSSRSTIAGRAAHAVAMTFVTRDRAGAWVPHWSRFGAVVTAEHLGNTWMPPGYRTQAEAWRGVGIQFGIIASFNLAREFLPGFRRSSPGND